MSGSRPSLCPKRAAAFAAIALIAGCTPKDFPEDPFVSREQDMVAPATEPLDTGFPSAEEAEAAKRVAADVFSLQEEAEALAERRETLLARDIDTTETSQQPLPGAADLAGVQDELTIRAAELRAREDIGIGEEIGSLAERRAALALEAEKLRNRQE